MVTSHLPFNALTTTPARRTPERRQSARYETTFRVTAVITDDTDDSRHNRICALQLLNLSDSGLAVLAAHPVPTGARINLFFTPHAAEPALQMVGTVVRQNPRDDGQYLLGVQFDRRCAA